MALNWNWDRKIGEMTLHDSFRNEDFTLNLYQGNAFLIMICEYTDNSGKEKYYVNGFFSDASHAKKCLGITKNCDGEKHNIYADMKSIRINKSRYSYTKELTSLLIQAFSNLDISLYSEE